MNMSKLISRGDKALVLLLQDKPIKHLMMEVLVLHITLQKVNKLLVCPRFIFIVEL